MLFSIELNMLMSYLKFYITIIIYLIEKHTYISDTLPKEDTVTYKFSQEQIHLTNLLTNNTFPEDFLFGVSAPSMHDERESRYMTRESEYIINNVTEYTNLNSHYKENILFAKSINSKMFKMSLSWAKILPNGFTNFINEDVIQQYNIVINEIIANGMTPMIIMFDWDLPLSLQHLGGCTNPILVKCFTDYARIIFEAFGDRVKFWVTINEANLMAYSDRSTRNTAAINQSGIADYLCGHYMLLAHANVYNMYNENFRQLQNGKVGIIQFYTWMEQQNDDSQADIYGQRRGLEWYNGWLTHPIFSKSGDYSKLMRNRIDFKSLFQGFSRSRLPYFTDKEMQLVKNSADFLGINFYREFKIRATEVWKGEVSFKHDADIAFLSETKSECDTRTEITTSAFGKLLDWLDNNYILPNIYIIGNSCANIEKKIANNKEIADKNGIFYLRQHISQIMKAMQKGVNIRGYLTCSFVNSFSRNNNLIRTSKMLAEMFKTRVVHSTTKSGEIIPEISEEIF